MTTKETEWLEDTVLIEKIIKKHGHEFCAYIDAVGLRLNKIVEFSGLPRNRVFDILHTSEYSLDKSPIFYSRYDPTDNRFLLWYYNKR